MSNENERELTDEELKQVLGGVAIGDIANLTKSPIKDNAVQALNGNTVNVVPQIPISVVNTSV